MSADRLVDERLARDLLRWGRSWLEAKLHGGELPVPPSAPGPAGLFFTLYDRDWEQRGSRGTTAPQRPLPELAVEVLQHAAFDDPRSPPLTADELDACKLAVTVLGPPVRITGPEGIEVGHTALRVRAGLFSGTTLPEAGWGRGWDAATFLAVACRKAGLHALAWKSSETEVLAYPSWRASEPDRP